MKDLHQEIISTYNRLGKRYLKRISKLVPSARVRFIKMLPKNARVLDVGCAGGRDSKAFVAKGFRVTGIDASRVFINEAKKYVPKARFFQKDLRKLVFPANSFDGIWAQAVLLHLKRNEVPKVLRSFYRLLKPGGVLHVEVKKGKGARYVKEALSAHQRRFFTFFTQSELETLVRKAGFKIIYSVLTPDELKRKNVPWVTVWGRKS